jgi:hypothetical protein
VTEVERVDACRTHRGKLHAKFWWEKKLHRKGYLRDQSRDRHTKNYIKARETGCDYVNQFDFDKNRAFIDEDWLCSNSQHYRICWICYSSIKIQLLNQLNQIYIQKPS